MAKEIELPDGSIAEFPDTMADAEIERVLQRQFGAGAAPTQGGPITDLPAVQARPDFSDVSATVESTAPVAKRSNANDSDLARLITGQPRKQGNAVTRFLGEIGGRQVLQGAYGLYGALGGDAIDHYVLSPLDRAAGWGNQLGTGGTGYRQAASGLADRLGMRRPETPGEKVSSDIAEALTGTALTMGIGGLANMGRTAATELAPTISSRLGDFLTAQPVLQTVSTATGAGASSSVREAGGGTGAQLVAALAGGLAPSAITHGVPAALRGTLRGGERNRVSLENAIKDFESLGATPSVGQGTGAWSRQGAENLLAAGPTSSGVMARFGKQQSEQLGEGLQGVADRLYRNPSAERAGRAVEEGIRGEGGFINTSRERADQLYRRLDDLMPQDARVDVANTRTALADLNSMIEGAPSVSRFFQNARLQGIERGLVSDTQGIDAVLTQPGMREQVDAYRAFLTRQAETVAQRNAERQALGMTNLDPVPTPADIDANINATLANMVDDRLPYEALQKLRTLVGHELENTSLVSDIPRSKWKAVYGALSRDMEAAATTPEARQALSRANAYFNARSKRIDAIDRVIDRNGGPEKIYNAVMQGTRDGGTTLRAVMHSLPEEGQKAITAATIRRMGMSNPGAQDAAGEAFSAATFLTNWNKVSPEARRALFDRYGPGFSKDMDKIARVAERIKDGTGALANPSGTAKQGAAFGYWGSLTAALLTGKFGTATTLAGGGALANIAARSMTNPRIVKWLAKNTETPVGLLPAQINVLKRIGSNNNDPDATELAATLSEQLDQGEYQQYGSGNGQ